MSGILAVIAAVGCVAKSSDEPLRGEVEKCEEGARNEEWDVDCSAACDHVLACRATYGDSDLEALTCNDCLGSCLAGVELGGNDIAESTEENRRSWECAEYVEGCSALDHNCDLF